jgi:NADH-quinone oxidoreductase subunit N
MTDADVAGLAPALILAAGALVAVLLAIPARIGPRLLAWLGVVAGAAAAVTAVTIGAGPSALSGSMVRDGASVFFVAAVSTVAAAVLALAAAGPRRSGRDRSEPALVLFSASGGALAVSATDLIVLAIGLVILAVPLYAQAARRAPRDLLLGASSCVVLLLGTVLVYVATGETSYAGLGRAAVSQPYLAGLALVLAGLAVQTVLAPGQRGSLVVNVAIVGALLRFVAATRSGAVALDWTVSFAVLAALAIAVASLAALTERRLRRLVGYATIAQLGYVSVAAAAFAPPEAVFALCASAAIGLGSFGVLAVLPQDEPVLGDLAGLARQRPILVLGLGVMVLGAIGVPSTAGFVAKIYVLEAAVRAQLLWLVVVGALATVVSTASYVRLVLVCFAAPRPDAVAPRRSRIATAVVVLAALAVLGAGLVRGPLFDAALTVHY